MHAAEEGIWIKYKLCIFPLLEASVRFKATPPPSVHSPGEVSRCDNFAVADSFKDFADDFKLST